MSIFEQILVLPLFSIFGLAVAVFILAKDLGKHERPSSTMAWLVSIVAIPFIAAPAYLLIGNRKLNRIESRRLRNTTKMSRAETTMTEISTVLETYGVHKKSGGNSVEFIDDGVEAWNKLCELIDSSRDSIHLMTFILDTDDVGKSIVDRLCARAQAGVEVRVQVDAIGSWKARLFLLRKLERAGAKVAVFLPALPFWRKSSANLRNHRKIAIFDGKIAFAGGMNIGEEYLGPHPDEERWIDSSAIYRGKVVTDLDEVFVRDWHFTTDELISPSDEDSSEKSLEGSAELQVVAGGPDVEGDPLYDVVTSAFHRAESRIWICTPYFVPDTGLMRVLAMQARAGLDVRIYVPKKSDSRTADFVRNRMLRRLRSAGVKCGAHPTKMVHAKHILVDETVSITGSANLDLRSLYINFEVAIFAYDQDSIKTSEQWFARLEKEFTETPLPLETKFGTLAEDVCWLASPLL